MDGSAATAHRVLLQIGRTRLALTQGEVRSLESAVDAVFDGARSPALGTIVAVGAPRPVFALDDELRALARVPRERRICVVIAASSGSFGLLCDEAQVLPRATQVVHALPPAMRSPGTPIEGVLAIGTEVAILATAEALARVTGADEWFASADAGEAQ